MTLLLLAAVAVASVQGGVPDTFGKTFVGRLAGKIEVRMQLERAGGRLLGRYSYVRVGDSLLGLKGTIGADGAFVLEEFDSGRRTGAFRGTLVRQVSKGANLLKLTGTWSSADGRRTLPFELVEEHLEVNGETIVYATAGIQDEDAKRGYAIAAAYPKFEGGSRSVVAKLNAEIERLVTKRVADFRKQAEEWTREHRAEGLKPDPSDLSIDFEALAVVEGLVSLRFSTFSYFVGTAHPSHDSEVFNYDVRAARRLELEDLFAPGATYLKALADYCIGELAPDGSVPAGAAPTRENYALWNITRDGLRITFAEYQVGPYVAGQPEVTIPYKELVPILRKGGPLARILKRD